MRIVCLALLIVLFAAWSGATALAQEPQVTGDQDGSSQQTEESDEAYRRRMELEDARRRDPTYTDPADDYRRDLEKIDKLPEESRNNIRDQLVDVIVDNPDWQPGDALKEYPYDPTAAAQADPGLMQQEQEAWDEQIEKYHAREAAAFGAYRGPVQGPGNPDGQEGGEEGQQGQEGQQGGQQGSESGQGGQQGSESSNGSAGTYQPYQSQGSSAEDAVSTEGVSESALDFLMQRQSGQAGGQPGQQQAGQPSGQQADQQANSQTGAQQAQQGSESSTAQDQPSEESQSPSQQTSQQQGSQQDQSESREDSQEESDQAQEQDMRGIIAIEDLDKLEGAGPGPVPAMPAEPEEEEEDPDDP